MTFTLIENGLVYAPEPLGEQSVLIANDRIVKIGSIDAQALRDFEVNVIDAEGCVVLPGLIDPHEHLIGAGGEHGFTSRMPEIPLEHILMAGITTVVGLLGTDTTTRHLQCLHAKTCQLTDEGITAYMYTGGFEHPPSTFLGSVLDDIVVIDKVIGLGELAISDARWVDPDLRELAMLVKSATLGGMMSGKAGVTHFHLGEGERRLSLLNALLDEYDTPPETLYVTHITRSEALMQEAIALAKRGAFVDMDVIDENLGDCVRYYQTHGGDMAQLTVSSDAHTPGGSPSKLYQQFVSTIREHGFSLETVLPLFTSNTATVLKLPSKGRLKPGGDGDVLILDADTYAIAHVFARGRQFVRDGELADMSKQSQQVQEAQA